MGGSSHAARCFYFYASERAARRTSEAVGIDGRTAGGVGLLLGRVIGALPGGVGVAVVLLPQRQAACGDILVGLTFLWTVCIFHFSMRHL